MKTTFDRLCAILIAQYQLAPESLTLDAPLEGLGIDSLGVVELLWNVEDEFRIKLPQEPIPLPNLGDVVRYIDDMAAQQPALAAAPGGGLEAGLPVS